MARGQSAWDPNVCIQFTAQLLNFIKENVVVDDRLTVYKMKYDQNTKEVQIFPPESDSKDAFIAPE